MFSNVGQTTLQTQTSQGDHTQLLSHTSNFNFINQANILLYGRPRSLILIHNFLHNNHCN